MRKHIIISALAAILLFPSCKKVIDSLVNQPPPPENNEAAVTAIGTPVGNAVTKTIDAGGGSITSADGRIELNFPAGALPGSTAISIQPVTNEAPNGIGLSYHLMPDGMKFNKPVTLTFHYGDSDINGTSPYLFYIAFQDASQQWRADVKNRNVDTIAKTVSLGILHFSIWTLGAELVMWADPDEVYEGNTSSVTIYKSRPGVSSSSAGNDPDDLDELPPLPVNEKIAANAISNWKVNGIKGGSSKDGTISGSGSEVVYTAPSSIDKKRTVQVSAELDYEISEFNNGNLIASVNKLILFTNITLLPSEFDFTVHLYYKNEVSGGAMPYPIIVEDRASFDLSLRKYKDPDGGLTVIALGTNYQNQAPACSPSDTYTWPDGSYFKCVPGSFGSVNITDISLLNFTEDSVIIQLIHTGTQVSGAIVVSKDGYADEPPQSAPGLPNVLYLALKDEGQTNKHPIDSYNWIEVTPK